MTRVLPRMAAFRCATRTGRRRSLCGALGAVSLALILLSVAGCRSHDGGAKMTAMPARSLTEVLAAHTPELMRLPGVVGTAESRLADGRPCVLVMVARRTPDLRRRIPSELEGWPVKVDETGEIHAMPDSGQ